MKLLLLLFLNLLLITSGYQNVDRLFHHHHNIHTHSQSRRSRIVKLDANVVVNNLDNNKRIEIEANAPLSLAAVRSDLRLSFQCKQGHCLSCEMLLDGKIVRACQTKVPNKRSINIQKKK